MSDTLVAFAQVYSQIPNPFTPSCNIPAQYVHEASLDFLPGEDDPFGSTTIGKYYLNMQEQVYFS